MKLNRFKQLFCIALFTVVMTTGTYISANTTDTTWSYTSSDGTMNTSYRVKDTKYNVYCYPKSGDLTLFVTVQGAKDASGSEKTKCSKKVGLTKGTQYTIVNSVKGEGNNFSHARLHMESINLTTHTNSGVWSPDSTKDYKVVGE